MNENPSSEPGIDEMMRRIRNELQSGKNESDEKIEHKAEVTAEVSPDEGQSETPFNPAPGGENSRRQEPEGNPKPRQKTEYRVEDFLAFEGEAFLENAYRVVLGRELDAPGRERFLDRLQSGKLSRIELLARLRYSPEGRARAVPINGNLAARGVARASFRLPIVGYLLALLNYLLKLPVLARSFETVQNDLLRERRHATEALRSTEVRLTRDLWNALDRKVDKEPFWELSSHAVDKKEFWDVLNTKADKEPIWDLAREKVSRDEFLTLSGRMLEKETFDAEMREREKEIARALDEKIDRHELFAIADEKVDRDSHETAKEELERSFREALNSKLDAAAYRSEKELEVKKFWQALTTKVDKEPFFQANGQFAGALNDVRSDLQGLSRKLQDQKTALVDQQRRLSLLLEEARKRLPETLDKEQIQVLAAAADHWLDAYYLSFEDVFRGTRQDIKGRAAFYLPIVRSANAGTDERPVIDLGCGRGELLELLHENGLVARGIDSNRLVVEQCRDAGYDVTEADAIDFLRQLPNASVGAITGLHIIEHIPFNRLVQLLDESLRVLKPGGVVAFETPNPENLTVGACNFYYDPTHINPLPPPVTRFLLEARGFVQVEIERLTEGRIVESLPLAREDSPASEPLNRVIEFLNARFAAAPDYALIGYKA